MLIMGCEKKHETAKNNYGEYQAITDNGNDRRGPEVYNRGFCKTCGVIIEYKKELRTMEDIARLGIDVLKEYEMGREGIPPARVWVMRSRLG